MVNTNTHTITLAFLLLSLSCITYAQYTCSPPCVNGGNCLLGNACNCTAGWTGPTCALPVCATDSNGLICGGNGQCTAPSTCKCNDGYRGSDCDQFYCPKGCVNGTCASANNCECQEGYTGIDCSTPVCDPGCQNFGTCIAPNKCNCDTTPGWIGAHCEIPVCNSTTGLCQHSTPCVGAGVCNCTGTGWVGTTCNLDRNECLMKNFTACDSRTKCSNTQGSWLCSACPSGYVGDGKTGCYPSCKYGCMNGGFCSGPNTCNCTGSGYTGDQCFEDLDECTTGGFCDPLVSCINTVGSYMCTGACPSNYTGSPYMSEGGCQPVCLGGCASGLKCVSPGKCASSSMGTRTVVMLAPLLFSLFLLLWI